MLYATDGILGSGLFFLFRRVSSEEDLPPLGHSVARQRVIPTVHWGRYPGTVTGSTAVVWV